MAVEPGSLTVTGRCPILGLSAVDRQGGGDDRIGTPATYPAYMALWEAGELASRARRAAEGMVACTMCPRACRRNRLAGEAGECGVGRHALVSSFGPHHGEERVLRGTHGSGTVFFGGCNLRCVFCQNYTISHWRQGLALDARRLAGVFLSVQRAGCHNVNLVTPSHVVPQILEALVEGIPRGLRLPLVYNSSGYDALPALRLLDGVVDIYMPDLKFSDPESAARYTEAPRYWTVARTALREMHRQVGPLRVEDGLARRGVLIRHLVMPGGVAGTRRVLEFIARDLSPDSWVNLMAQYRPALRAWDYPEIARPITEAEYRKAVAEAERLGIHRGVPFDEPS